MTTSLKYITSKYLYLTTANRINGSPINGAQILFPQNLLKGSNTNEKKIIKVNLQDLQVNREWYNIQNNRNNNFIFNGVPGIIPEGNPSVYTLRDALNTLLNPDFVVSYDISLNKYTFASQSGLETFSAVNCGSLLGLVDGVTYTGSFSSIYPVNMQYEHSLYLQADFATCANNLDNINTNVTNVSNIIARIPITSAPFDDITFNSFKNVNEALEIATFGFDTATFSLVTNRGYKPVLNHNFTFSLKLEIYVKE